MNKTFEEYTKSSAFRIDLSPRMIGVLLHLTSRGPEDERLNMAPYQALARRGLVYWDSEGCKVTTAGNLVSGLLVEAGYSEKVTQTNSEAG